MERIARVAQHVVGERPGLAAELAELAALFRDGMLTAAEFSAAKAQLSHSIDGPADDDDA